MSKADTVGSSSSRFVSCVVLCGRNPDVSPSDGNAAQDFFNAADCDGWWFVPTGTFIAVFLAEQSGAERASACEMALRGVSQPWAQSLALGRGEGELLCTFTSAGDLAQMPMGIALNDAINDAVKRAS